MHPPSRRFFFAHIMKTAGTNFLVQFDRLFPADAIWPQYRPGKETAAEHWDTISDYLSLGSLLALSDEQRRQLAFVAGHLPFATVELLPDNGDLACLTLLRDPVERTVSFLAQCRKHRPELSDLPLESIYDDPWYFDRFVRDHQTRVLSMTLEEAMAPRTDQQLFTDFLLSLIPTSATATERAHVEELVAEGQPLFSENTGRVVAALEAIGVDMTDTRDRYEAMAGQPQYRVPEGGMGFLYADAALSRPSPVDAARLATAKANLDRCAVVGITSDYAGFIDDLNTTFDLHCSAEGWINVGERRGDELPASFRRRIADDNQHDLELYGAACELVARRRSGG